MTNSAAAKHRGENVARMNNLEGFDVVIVCTGSSEQASYWQARLESGLGAVLPFNTTVLAVTEDWPGGAGNALGTLFAWQNAADLAKSRCNLDLASDLAAGTISVGMFHTAGKGTRLAPLPGSESNNKPGVKLPATLKLADGTSVLLTILEAVIKQTGVYGRSRRGRLSVFWGDQVFIPSVAADYTPTAHADILCTLGPMPDAAQWKARGLHSYGLIAVNKSGAAAQVEKVDHPTATRMLATVAPIESVGTSLGSFSISSQLLEVLLEEFSSELSARVGKLDTDPHLWMPMTLPCEAYVELMGQKGVSSENATLHHGRMAQALKRLQARPDGSALKAFGAVDIGADAYWWDYGQLPLYLKSCLLMTQEGEQAELLRAFVGVPEDSPKHIGGAVLEGSRSVVSGCELQSGKVASGSTLAGVNCCHIQAEGCVIVNVHARRITAAPGSVIYNVTDDSAEGLVAEAGDVIVGIWHKTPHNGKQEQMLLHSHATIDGGKSWKERIKTNIYSFEDVHTAQADANVTAIELERAQAAKAMWASMQLSTQQVGLGEV